MRCNIPNPKYVSSKIEYRLNLTNVKITQKRAQMATPNPSSQSCNGSPLSSSRFTLNLVFSFNSCRRFPSCISSRSTSRFHFWRPCHWSTLFASSAPSPPLPLVEWQVAQAPRCARFARSLVRNWYAHARLRAIDRVLDKCIRHWRNEATKKSSLYTIVCLVVSGATSEHVYRYDRVLLIVARNMFVQHFYRLSFNDNGERY